MSKRPAANRSGERVFRAEQFVRFDRIDRGRRLSCTFSHPASFSITLIPRPPSSGVHAPVDLLQNDFRRARIARSTDAQGREQPTRREVSETVKNFGRRKIRAEIYENVYYSVLSNLRRRCRQPAIERGGGVGQISPVFKRVQKKLCYFTFLTGFEFSLVADRH